MQTKIAEIKNEINQLGTNEQVLLIGVSKTYPIVAIEQAYHYGITDFGENKVQELLDKMENINLPINWHFIGHLQTNKVKYIIGKVKLIHSVDSLKLLKEIDKQSYKKQVITDVLLEVNVAKEESKWGFFIEDLNTVLNEVTKLTNVKVKGLMTPRRVLTDSIVGF